MKLGSSSKNSTTELDRILDKIVVLISSPIKTQRGFKEDEKRIKWNNIKVFWDFESVFNVMLSALQFFNMFSNIWYSQGTMRDAEEKCTTWRLCVVVSM